MRTNICLAFMASPLSPSRVSSAVFVDSGVSAVGAGGTVYRFYVNAQDDTDKLSAVFGNDLAHLVITTPSNIFNSPMNASWNASGVNPAFLGFFPDLADDSYATIGLEGPAAMSGLAGAADPSLVEDSALSQPFQVTSADRAERQYPHGWVMVCVEHCGQRAPNQRTLVDCANHHCW